jgi:hypothetical protein
LKRLHETLSVSYFYVEWREALAALGLASAGGATVTPARLSLPQLRL